MQKREKVKQIYKKLDIKVEEDYINGIMNNKERLKSLMRMYKEQEIDSMNDIFGKEYDNKVFTRQELEFVRDIDLFDPHMIRIAKMIWEQKDNPIMLKIFARIVKSQKENQTRIIKLIKKLEREVNCNERSYSKCRKFTRYNRGLSKICPSRKRKINCCKS